MVSESVGAPTTQKMDFKELIAMINRNTAAQKEQNRRWRQKCGLPDPEPRGEEPPLPAPEREAPLSPAPEPEEELPLPEPRGEELPLPEPRGEELPLPEPRGEELPLPEPRGEELPLPEPRGEELPLPEPRGEELPLPEPRGEELPLPEPRGEELPLPEPRGEELPLPEPRGEKPPLPEPRGEELPLSEPRGEKPPLPEPRGEAKSRPPPQPRPPPLKTSPATDGAVPCPDVVVPLPECQDLPLLVLTPGSQHCQAQLLAWSPTPLLLDLQTSRREGQTLHALPLFLTLFPLKLQASLRGSTVAHLCQSLLAPGCRPALQSPSSSRPGSPSLVRGPFQEMPEGLTHPQARPQEGAKIDICGLEGGWLCFRGGGGLGMADQCCTLEGEDM
ncbi:UNVERIFIED_CONTAM: hypothetical protein FKN15_010807 [Acipenser sinensis]